MLSQLLGSETLNIATEEQLLHQIRLVAVKGLHKEVHWHTFHNIRQQEEEGITHFLAKFQSQAKLCEFTVNCTNGSCQQQVNYSEDMVAGQLVAGLLNTEHQGKILAEANILTTLEQKFHRLVSLESADKATAYLRNNLVLPTTFGSVRSEQKRSLYEGTPRISSDRTCKGCGEISHPDGLRGRKNCPAAKLRCFNCGLTGHLRKVCRRQVKGSSTGSTSTSTEHQSIILSNRGKENQASCERRRELSAIPHLAWSKGKFHKSLPEPPPSRKIEIPLMAESHAKSGRTLSEKKTSRRTHCIRAVADTGAQTCSSGLEILKILGCTSDSLIPTNHRIRVITDDQLRIKGVLFMRISVGIRETRQVVNVSENTSGFYFGSDTSQFPKSDI